MIWDQGITTAILDRLLHRVKIIHSDDDSHRMRNRKSLFSTEM
ncbi:ATP-binding protein [Exiguobacterium sp. IPCH1]